MDEKNNMFNELEKTINRLELNANPSSKLLKRIKREVLSITRDDNSAYYSTSVSDRQYLMRLFTFHISSCIVSINNRKIVCAIAYALSQGINIFDEDTEGRSAAKYMLYGNRIVRVSDMFIYGSYKMANKIIEDMECKHTFIYDNLERIRDIAAHCDCQTGMYVVMIAHGMITMYDTANIFANKIKDNSHKHNKDYAVNLYYKFLSICDKTKSKYSVFQLIPLLGNYVDKYILKDAIAGAIKSNDNFRLSAIVENIVINYPTNNCWSYLRGMYIHDNKFRTHVNTICKPNIVERITSINKHVLFYAIKENSTNKIIKELTDYPLSKEFLDENRYDLSESVIEGLLSNENGKLITDSTVKYLIDLSNLGVIDITYNNDMLYHYLCLHGSKSAIEEIKKIKRYGLL